jgi:hypothetical protein
MGDSLLPLMNVRGKQILISFIPWILVEDTVAYEDDRVVLLIMKPHRA